MRRHFDFIESQSFRRCFCSLPRVDIICNLEKQMADGPTDKHRQFVYKEQRDHTK